MTFNENLCYSHILSTFPETLKKELPSTETAELLVARVISGSGETCHVIHAHGRSTLFIPGHFYYSQQEEGALPITGDWLLVRSVDESNVLLEKVLPRSSVFVRRDAGAKGKKAFLVANVDCLVIVTALDEDFSVERIRRYMLLAKAGNMNSLIVLNKIDLVTDPEIYKKQVQDSLGHVPLILLQANATDPRALDALYAKLESNKSYALIGSSGAGKSTLINALSGEKLSTTEVRKKDAKGRHTTARREMICSPRGFILVDQPGLREVGLIDTGESLDWIFESIVDLARNCHFSNCTHEREPGCAVREAVEDGVIYKKDLEQYRLLKSEGESFRQVRKKGTNSKAKWKSIHKEIRIFQKKFDKRKQRD